MIIGISGKIGSGKDTIGSIIQYLIWRTYYSNPEFPAISERHFKEYKYSLLPLDSTFQIKKFADKLKDIVCLLTGCTREQLEDAKFKDTEIGEDWVRYAYAIGYGTRNEETLMWSNTCTKEEYEEHYRINWQTAYKKNLTYRDLLQLLGTECGRNTIHPNIWINSLMSDYLPNIKNLEQFGIDFFKNKGYNREDLKNSNFELYKEVKAELFKQITDTCPNWIITDCRFSNELEAIKDRNGISIRVNRLNKYEESFKAVYDKTQEHPSEIALDNAIFDYTIDNNGSIEELIDKVKEILIKENII